MREFRLLDTGPLTAAANMCLDKIILEEVAERQAPPTVRFLQFSPAAALVGYHQDVDLEVRWDYCVSHGIDINRRHTGGGAIFFQESALGWELYGIPGEEPFIGSYEAILYRICAIAASGLSRLGFSAAFRPRNDIEVDGRKISGTGGTTISGGFMFQGTVLVENEVDLFLRALRVPVEKLKKREIESLMERICFLSDLLSPTPAVSTIKDALADEFAEKLNIRLVPGDLTKREERRLTEEIGFFDSPAWVMGRTRPSVEGQATRSITQTDAGTLRVHLWPSPGGKRVRQALIAGDFFTVPKRLIHDLEAVLVGLPMEKQVLTNAVNSFLGSNGGCILGIESNQVAEAVGKSVDRLALRNGCFTLAEANEIFLVNLLPEQILGRRPRWLLLPYCSKSLDCPYRDIPGCDECGECEIGACFSLARSFDMEPITVQSFEHLMDVISTQCRDRAGMYVGSCCEAFYAKHQQELESVRAQGLLIDLDSTTCYDLGKAALAYQGRFDNKTELNLPLIEKTLRHLHGAINGL
jgi:lipoate-protein ligase A